MVKTLSCGLDIFYLYDPPVYKDTVLDKNPESLLLIFGLELM